MRVGICLASRGYLCQLPLQGTSQARGCVGHPVAPARFVVVEVPVVVDTPYTSWPPKNKGFLRPILDIKHVNCCLRVPQFHIKTLRSVIMMVQEGEFLITLYLTEAYLHITFRLSINSFYTLWSRWVTSNFRPCHSGWLLPLSHLHQG